MTPDVGTGHEAVHCRTGSLEIQRLGKLHSTGVHCRTGSLEIDSAAGDIQLSVHCRTGSLENGRTASQYSE